MSKVAKLDLRTLEFQVYRNTVSTATIYSARTRGNGKHTYGLPLAWLKTAIAAQELT